MFKSVEKDKNNNKKEIKKLINQNWNINLSNHSSNVKNDTFTNEFYETDRSIDRELTPYMDFEVVPEL